MSEVTDLTAARQRRGAVSPVDEARLDEAVRSIRHDYYSDDDLRVAGITRDQAEDYLRRDILARLARTYSKETLQAAAKLKDRQLHDPRLDGYLREAWPTLPGVLA